jgi:D-amino-acid oxidase
MRIAIVGKGVIGLSCGLTLARDGHTVTILSRPPEREIVTTSMVAAAFWFPYLTTIDPTAGFDEADLAGPSLDHFLKLADVPEAYVTLAPAIEYVGQPATLPDRWWHRRPEVRFRAMSAAEIPTIPAFGPLTGGAEFRLPVVYMPGYLVWLADQYRRAGGLEQTIEIEALDQIRDFDVVVNCSGIDARTLAPDPEVTAIRGQVLSVRDVPYPHNTLYFLDSGDNFEKDPVYIVPRGKDVVLGGTAEPLPAELASLTSAEAHRGSDAVTARILERCSKLRPEFAGARDFTVKVGLRPYRAPIRMEWDGDEKRRTPVIHCYGHGGAGVTLSWGSAAVVSRLIGPRH